MGTKIKVYLIQVCKMAIILQMAPDEKADYTHMDTAVTVPTFFSYTSPIKRGGYDQ